MALGALVKGPQAPIYFVAVTVGYLIIVQRDWRTIFHWSHLGGLAAAAAVIGAWQVPYYLMTDIESVRATWAGLAADRFQITGLAAHLVTYPLETLACLLPWSPLLVALINRPFRDSLKEVQGLVGFSLTAVAITYPTVWFASAARGRYFMPLYPCIAVLIGLVIERCVAAQGGSWGRLNWRNFLAGVSAAAGIAGVTVAAASFMRAAPLAAAAQSKQVAIAFLMACVASSLVLLWCRRTVTATTAQTAVVVISALVGFAYCGLVINVYQARWNDPRAEVLRLKSQLPGPARLVSFGPVDFRFCYHFRDQIPELPWPTAITEIPAGVEYFCMDWHPGDTAASRLSGRGRSWSTGPGLLPFEWEEIGRVCVERRIRDQPQAGVIVARIKSLPSRPIAAATRTIQAVR
jgi:hypothetical protein